MDYRGKNRDFEGDYYDLEGEDACIGACRTKNPEADRIVATELNIDKIAQFSWVSYLLSASHWYRSKFLLGVLSWTIAFYPLFSYCLLSYLHVRLWPLVAVSAVRRFQEVAVRNASKQTTADFAPDVP